MCPRNFRNPNFPRNPSMDLNNDMWKYLSEMRQHYSHYHHHKEAAAWAVVPVYAVLLKVLFDSAEKVRTGGLPVLLIMLAGVVILCWIAISDLSVQFNLRWFASVVTIKCFEQAGLIAQGKPRHLLIFLQPGC